MGDDGIGVRVVQELKERYRFPAGVEFLDGGTLGLDLLPRLEGVERLLIVDAVETGGAPGTVIRLSGDEIPVAMATKLSPHQMGLKDLLSVATLMDYRIGEMVFWGVQPERIDMGLELSAAATAAMEPLGEEILGELARWGLMPLD